MAPKNLEYLEEAQKRAYEKKTHVSFPQLKYPSLRDKGFRDPVQWLTGKALDDGAEGLWRIHNSIYDFTTFVDNHPGGAEWLELTKGTDITEAFEAHHLNPVVEKMLDKYFVKNTNTPRNSPYTFNEDGFYRTLKRAVREELKKVPKNIPNHTDRIIDGLFTTCLATAALTCWAKNYWIVMLSYLISSLTLAWTIVASHNYIHRKTNWRMYIFSMCLWSYRDFRVSHALSHHLYPNTLMDLEISAFEPIIQWNPRPDKPFFTYFTFLFQCLLYPFSFIINFVKRFLLNFVREDFFKNHYRWHDGIGLLLPIWMWVVSGCSFSDAIINWLWINCTSSFIFMVIGTTAAHHHPRIFKDGDEVRTITPDWGMQQLEAVMDRNDINGSLFKVMTFFGDHALHHLFPTLDHAVLPYLYPVFLEHCEKFRANFRVTSQFDLFVGQIKRTIERQFRLLDD
ncbi:unnamed protein product [Diatraea saccharalis]|uniref:Cytochrome b5-related protein n=1 Tax=Diatraea saccharalis TaxID=40085 RepID=A0A9N9RCX7_9NEOP|nr:unnamed protein product [Diatraea saccharalis]